MSKWSEQGHYELWGLSPDKNWERYASISFMHSTKESAIEYASKHVNARPSQLMHVLPSGRKRVALWIDQQPVALNAIPEE